MEAEKQAIVLKGIALSAAYCVAYIVLRKNSVDQWFLPAGLRVGTLLFFPFRYWPYLLAGDMAALLIIRVPMADRYSVQWSYLSSLLLAPVVAMPLYFMRKRFKTANRIAYALPLIAIPASLWSSIFNNALNFFLDGPMSKINYVDFSRYAIGDYLGILMISLPVALLVEISRATPLPQKLPRDAAAGAACLLFLFLTIYFEFDSSHVFKNSLSMLMIVPVVLLTFLHGWHGAAIGVVGANLAIAQTLESGKDAIDDSTLVAQIALSIAASTLLVLGAKISQMFERVRKLGVSEAAALEIARTSFFASERNMRDRVIYLAQMQLMLDDQRKDLVELLKVNGQQQAALLLNNEAVAHMRAFEANAAALYPLKIEELGLYGAIYPPEFTDFWAGATEVMYFTRGEPQELSLGLQLATYRCLCNAFVLLSDMQPDVYRVKIHTWRHGAWRGISVRIRVSPDHLPESTPSTIAAEFEIERRVKAHGGAYKRRYRGKLHFLLWEKADSVVAETLTPAPLG